ncbi:helix-turn-helix domain-containing protein [Streptomyces sp. NPDC048209]|uniref:helix-turn-helix domain-containing protein n=1 Tax=Streptomyces sp. NPDC048209 TaxID=3156689 RepID=UPI0034412204
MESSQQRRCTSCGSALSRYNAGARCGPCQRGLRIAPEFWDDPQVQQAVSTWDLGTLCRLIRRHTGMPQAAFARIVNSDQSEISRLERGQRAIKDRRKMTQWAQVLNFPEELAGPLPSESEHPVSTTQVARRLPTATAAAPGAGPIV